MLPQWLMEIFMYFTHFIFGSRMLWTWSQHIHEFPANGYDYKFDIRTIN